MNYRLYCNLSRNLINFYKKKKKKTENFFYNYFIITIKISRILRKINIYCLLWKILYFKFITKEAKYKNRVH